MSDKKAKRHQAISFSIEDLGLEGEINDVIHTGCMNIISNFKITKKDLDRYKLNRSSYYGETDASGVIETYIVDILEDLIADEDLYEVLLVE